MSLLARRAPTSGWASLTSVAAVAVPVALTGPEDRVVTLAGVAVAALLFVGLTRLRHGRKVLHAVLLGYVGTLVILTAAGFAASVLASAEGVSGRVETPGGLLWDTTPEPGHLGFTAGAALTLLPFLGAAVAGAVRAVRLYRSPSVADG